MESRESLFSCRAFPTCSLLLFVACMMLFRDRKRSLVCELWALQYVDTHVCVCVCCICSKGSLAPSNTCAMHACCIHSCVRICVQQGFSCAMMATQDGHLEVIKCLCENVGEKLLVLRNNVSACMWSVFAWFSLLLWVRVCAWA